ncbi:adenine deaminase [Bacillus oleivorans]|uniref:adenine deaminase n=1 Tax=Bacillus oleivorans TaxID=1448271 RepID=A0A285CTX3_9BACI|nr:adenine deaminase C-terminal domain-containing protein [Bacillus oleivorans]SNX70964.1 adenine deaminase [Bacillus oleivorans]
MNHINNWRIKQHREHTSIIDGAKSPTLLLKNARYLHPYLKKWLSGQIWIYQDRIVYVGEKLPERLEECEIIDCTDSLLVPGYIEPHAHPFQVYNPLSLANYASQTGTTALINDSLVLALLNDKKKAFSLLDEFKKLPVSMYWWCRFDSQTELFREETIFSHETIQAWIEREDVIQGGELTSWPRLMAGDDSLLHWIQEIKRNRKRIEGHFPGASEKTLVKLKLLGADADHESMTGQEVWNRLQHGYAVALRYSSIRPDLPILLKEMKELGIEHFDQVFFTTDGSTPSFYKEGMIDLMIKMALEEGIPPIEAYLMASFNVARYYQIDDLYGSITTGRVANINFLHSEADPTPHSVLAKGQWVKRNGDNTFGDYPINWSNYGLKPYESNWELTMDDLQFSMAMGIEMVNAVITKPYSANLDLSVESLSDDHDQCFFMLVDRKGRWKVNTVLKGFAHHIGGFASSFSISGDLILIGKHKSDMLLACRRLKELGGGIVLTENGKVLHEIPLPLNGVISDKRMEEIMEEETKLKVLLEERGYRFGDPIYTLLFFSSTHLPYIRITQQGLFDVMKKMVLFPSVIR